MIWIIVLILAVFFLLYATIDNRQKKREYFYRIDQAQDMLNIADKEMDIISSYIFDIVSINYGENFVKNIENGIISIGMPSELLVLSWGKPADIKKKIYKGNSTELWYYGSFVNRLGNIKFTTEVVIENNNIVGWQDL